MPGYTLFLAGIYTLFGTGPAGGLALSLIQAALGSLTAGLVYLIGRRLGGPRVALVAGLLAACYLPAVYYVTFPLTETCTPLCSR